MSLPNRRLYTAALILAIVGALVVSRSMIVRVGQSPGADKLPQSRAETSDRDLPDPRKNVLFLITDDMRTQMESYEGPEYLFKQPEMKTPNFRRLASRSLLLKNAFVQYSLCNPSRTSLLTSRRPDTTRVYGNNLYFRTAVWNFTTLPQYFKERGYTSVGMGKVFHRGADGYSDPLSWSEPFVPPVSTDTHYMQNASTDGRTVALIEEPDFLLADTVSVNRALEFFKSHRLGRGPKKPFFLSVGFKKPHAALACPKQFFDLYTIDNKTSYLNQEERSRVRLTDDQFKAFRRAYYACISYVDSLVGRLMDALEENNLLESTVVSFTADHGYHYGEHGYMGKSLTYDMTTRVPTMLRVPGRTDSGVVSEAIVESVDLFPTIVEAAGLKPVPRCPADSSHVDTCTEGVSFLPLVDAPDSEIKGEAYSQRVLRGAREMTYSVRTPRYRFTQKARRDSPDAEYRLDDSEVVLYDHSVDFREYTNVALDRKYSSVVRDLHRKLAKYAAGRYRGGRRA